MNNWLFHQVTVTGPVGVMISPSFATVSMVKVPPPPAYACWTTCKSGMLKNNNSITLQKAAKLRYLHGCLSK